MTRWKGRAGGRGIGSLAGKLRQRQVPAESGRRYRRQARQGGGQALPLPLGVQAQRQARPGAPLLRQLSIPSPPASPDQRSPCRLQEEPLQEERQHPWERHPGLLCSLQPPPRGESSAALLLEITPTRPLATGHQSHHPCLGDLHLRGSQARGTQSKEGSRSGYPTPTPGLYWVRKGDVVNIVSFLHAVPKFRGDTFPEGANPRQ